MNKEHINTHNPHTKSASMTHAMSKGSDIDRCIEGEYVTAQDCMNDPACSENCPICCQLPVNIKTGQMVRSIFQTQNNVGILQASWRFTTT